MRKPWMKRSPDRTVAATFAVAGALLSVVVSGLAGTAFAQEGRTGGSAEHGGTVAETRSYRFEVVFRADGVWVYPRGKDGKAVATGGLGGKVTFYHPNSPEPWFDLPLRATGPGPLAASVGLSKAPATGAKATFRVTGLPDSQEATATFTVPVALSRARTGGVAGALTVARSTQADQPAINAQKTCPVSGESLGSMGTPIKVSRGGRSVFLCCQSCVKRVQAKPDQYLGPRATEATPK